MNIALNRKGQSGLSLLELLIAMVIGLFLLAGITTTYLQSKQSSIKRDEYSILQGNGRTALELMASTIVHAGYVSFPNGVLTPSSFITSPVTSNSCNGGGQNVEATEIFQANSTKDGAAGASDSIGVIYLGDVNLFTDCAGRILPANCQITPGNSNSDAARIYSSFYIKDNALQCAGSRSAALEVIAEDVENIQFLYGIDVLGADGKSDGAVDRYVNATDIGTFNANVISVQIGVLVKSELEVKSEAEAITYTLLDESITSPSDRFLRAVFTTTVNLRNTL